MGQNIKELQETIAEAQKEIKRIKGGFNESAGRNIKKLREAKKMTPLEMANLIGMTSSTVGTIEKGKVNITVPNLMMICNVLECTPNDILIVRQ
jgi:DNA-binding Xre family transcriptional regulator